jgi:hypothetical protein
MIKRSERRWCVQERRPTGPDKIFYISENFRKREDAEREMKRLAALPEKAGNILAVTISPQGKPKPRRRPSKSFRKTTRS